MKEYVIVLVLFGLLLHVTPVSHAQLPTSRVVDANLISGPRPAFPVAAQNLVKGEINERVVSKTDPAQSYALYLPANYMPDKKWPILYCFDPEARGIVPVKRYQSAAEKYGWIVAGSNNSQNGPFQLSLDANGA